MSNILFAAETVVDKLSDEHIYSPCPPAVKGKGAFQISPIIKKTKTSLKKKTRTSWYAILVRDNVYFSNKLYAVKYKLLITSVVEQ